MKLALSLGLAASLLLPAKAQAQEESPYTPLGGVFACIRHYESRGNYQAISRSGKFHGAYQFDRSKMRHYFGNRPIHQVSPQEQDARALELYRKRGLSPWPTPRRRCRGYR